MKFERRTKEILLFITYAVALFMLLTRFDLVLIGAGKLFSLVSPFLVGIAIAFVLNIPMMAIENALFPDRWTKSRPILRRIQRPVSTLLAFLFIVFIFFVVTFLIAPEIGRTAGVLKERLPSFLSESNRILTPFLQKIPWLSRFAGSWETDWTKLLDALFSFTQRGAGSVLSSTFDLAASVMNGLFNFSVGVVFAAYALTKKERLLLQLKKVLYAYLPERTSDRILRIGALADRTFSSFLSGQCAEAAILGVLFFIGMSIFSFPYALMVSVFIAFTALVPVFGAFIGGFVGTFLILVEDPGKALWFLLLFFILQQIEGSFLYPRVVGNSIGLPSIFVLVGVILGGKLFGILGMLVFIPLCSVFYQLFREAVQERLKNREIPEEKVT